MGIYPKLFFSKMDVTVEKFLQDVRGRAGIQTQGTEPKGVAEIKK
jgi:hypothetical protein